MSAGLTLVVIVAAAYLAARVAFDWLARRFLIVSGAEYVVLGILLGPQVTGLLRGNALQSFAPITVLAIGWMGAIIGTRFYLPDLVAVRGITYRLAFVESALTFATVFGLESLVMYLVGVPAELAWLPGVALGAVATASTSAAADVVAGQLGADRPMVGQLRVSTNVNALVAVLAFGVLLSIHHRDPGVLDRPITPTEWMVITIAIGVAGGSLFYLFVGAEEHEDRLLIALGGAVIVVSGATEYLGLSPLVAGFFFGAIIVNTADNREEVTAALESVERPLYFILLVVAGASWVPARAPWAAGAVALFLCARAAGKLGGARLATRMNGMLEVLGPDWGRGLLGQGGLALALGINYMYQDVPILANVVFSAAIVSVLLTDFLSARMMHAAVLAAEEEAPVDAGSPAAEMMSHTTALPGDAASGETR